MFVKTLQQGVESTHSNLEEFKKVYTSFCERAFAPLLGNVDANNLCVNELVKDVTVHERGCTVPYTKSPQNESNSFTSGKGHGFWVFQIKA